MLNVGNSSFQKAPFDATVVKSDWRDLSWPSKKNIIGMQPYEIHMFAHWVGPFLPSTKMTIDVIQVSFRTSSIFEPFNYFQTLVGFVTFWYSKERHIYIWVSITHMRLQNISMYVLNKLKFLFMTKMLNYKIFSSSLVISRLLFMSKKHFSMCMHLKKYLNIAFSWH